MYVNKIYACSGGVCSIACTRGADDTPQDKENAQRTYRGASRGAEQYELFVGGGDGTVTLFRVDDVEKQMVCALCLVVYLIALLQSFFKTGEDV